MESSIYKERVKIFSKLIENENFVNLTKLQEFCFEGGIPDDCLDYRSLVWRILLDYLPINKNEWSKILKEKRLAYEGYVNEFILSDQSNTQVDDHPLNPSPNSQWNIYFKDNEILSQIFKDVKRLYPEISFFQKKVDKKYFNKNKGTCDIIGRSTTNEIRSSEIVTNFLGLNKIKDEKDKVKYINEFYNQSDFSELIVKNEYTQEYHWQVISRILFIYAKLNTGQGYVQGMNEIIGPIYYVFANDNQADWSEYREADTFWCFTSLMSEIRDMYNSQLDSDQSVGIVSMMTKLNSLLFMEDSAIYTQLNQNQLIKPHYYAFRWITLLLSQEFPLPEVLHIWDFLFSDRERFNFLIKICCAMILLLKDDLLNNDFAFNMKLLQNFPQRIDVNCVIKRAKMITRKIK